MSSTTSPTKLLTFSPSFVISQVSVLYGVWQLIHVQFKFAQNPETRRLAHESYEARLEVNAPLLDKALELRRNIASLLGYDTWADYITEVKMIKTSRAVNEVRLLPKPLAITSLFTLPLQVP